MSKKFEKLEFVKMKVNVNFAILKVTVDTRNSVSSDVIIIFEPELLFASNKMQVIERRPHRKCKKLEIIFLFTFLRGQFFVPDIVNCTLAQI